jgi:hypothetical protein
MSDEDELRKFEELSPIAECERPEGEPTRKRTKHAPGEITKVVLDEEGVRYLAWDADHDLVATPSGLVRRRWSLFISIRDPEVVEAKRLMRTDPNRISASAKVLADVGEDNLYRCDKHGIYVMTGPAVDKLFSHAQCFMGVSLVPTTEFEVELAMLKLAVGAAEAKGWRQRLFLRGIEGRGESVHHQLMAGMEFGAHLKPFAHGDVILCPPTPLAAAPPPSAGRIQAAIDDLASKPNSGIAAFARITLADMLRAAKQSTATSSTL